jgi:ABC-type lipoprotein release transport system permease subunit
MPTDFRGPDEHSFGRADYWVPMPARFVVAAAASYLPAGSASRVDPIVSLRME